MIPVSAYEEQERRGSAQKAESQRKYQQTKLECVCQYCTSQDWVYVGIVALVCLRFLQRLAEERQMSREIQEPTFGQGRKSSLTNITTLHLGHA
jgi:hypothetical protein